MTGFPAAPTGGARNRRGRVPSPPCRVRATLCFCLLVLFLGAGGATAAPVAERSLALSGELLDDGRVVKLSWPKATGSGVGRVSIQRRVLGQTGKESWREIASIRSFARIYTDSEIKPGVAYEYRVSRPGKQQIDSGYWVTGLEVPAEEKRGVALLIVDETLAPELAPRLQRFMLDLAGAGWKVVRHDVPRGSDKDPAANLKAARKIRSWIQERFNSAHYEPHALILVGRIPIVRSGKSAPDGHKRRPQETDLFYADTNAIWHDDGQGVLQHNVIPGDHIEMQVGRIDFSHLDDAFGDEISLMKRYLDKNHHWRHGRLGDLREAYGANSMLTVEINALRNIVGPDKLTAGRHHDAGRRQPWLLGVDFGSSQYEKYVGPPTRAVFTINFGSGKLNFSQWKNEMKALLAQPWYVLSTGWGGRPSWQLHHMALGNSIGYSHMRTVNNGSLSRGGPGTLEYTPTGDYEWVNPVWVNLLGDPTLRPFPLRPVRKLRAEARADGVLLRWDRPDGDADLQYRIYRARDRFGPYQALNPGKLHGETQYIDANPVAGAWYMVRAHALKQVHAGSFYTFSQGAFATPGNQPPTAIDESISTPMQQVAGISFSARDADAGDRLLFAPVRDGDGGRLLLAQDGWSFVPDAGFSGRVQIPFSVFDGVATDDGVLSIDVVAP